MTLHPDWPAIGRELIEMADEDLRVRAELAATGELFQGYHPRMRAVHDRHAARLSQILEHGWPGEHHVGSRAAEAAWLIVQHAIAQPDLQRRTLAMLRTAAARGEAPPWQAAMFEDRVRVFEGRLQLYGTQFDWDADGRLSPLPIEDLAGVDERRRGLGLRPLEEEIAARCAAAAREGEKPPPDWEARRCEMQAWLREVGWILCLAAAFLCGTLQHGQAQQDSGRATAPRVTNLAGARDQPGLFTQRLIIPAGFCSPLHVHNHDLHGLVLRGVLWMGFQDSAGRLHAREYGPGSFVPVPAGQHHVEGSRAETEIHLSGIGPLQTTTVDSATPGRCP